MTAAGKVTSGWTPVAAPIPVPAPLLTGRKGFLYPELQSALFIYFPLSPKATLARARCSPVSSLQDSFHKVERRGIQLTPRYICISGVTVRWPQETGTERLTCTPCFGQAPAANMRQVVSLIPFKVLLRECDVWLDQTNFVTWRNLSCQKHVIKWKVFSSAILTLFSRLKALLLLHFRTGSLAVSILLNKASPQKTGLCSHYKKLNRVSNEIKFNYLYLMTGMCF